MGSPPLRASTAGSAAVLDCDVVAHQAYEPGTAAFADVVAEFGHAVVNEHGTIDRKALGALVFADDGGEPRCRPPRLPPAPRIAAGSAPDAALADRTRLGAGWDAGKNMKRLTDIVWPATAKLTAEKLKASTAEMVVMEAAVLLEAGWDAMADEVWTINAPHAAVLERLSSRNGMSAEQAEARIAKQMSAEQRLERCHVPLSSAFGEAAMREQLALALHLAQRRSRRTLCSEAEV